MFKNVFCNVQVKARSKERKWTEQNWQWFSFCRTDQWAYNNALQYAPFNNGVSVTFASANDQ